MIKLGLLIISIVLLIDIITYIGLRQIFRKDKSKGKIHSLPYVYWGISFITLLFVVLKYFINKNSQEPDYIQFRGYFIISNIIFLEYFPKALFACFFLLKLLLLGCLKIGYYIFSLIMKTKYVLSFRLNFVLYIGLVFSLISFGLIFHGIFIGRTNFVVNEVEVYSPNLPKAFDGLRIAHISDAHLGSFYNHDEVKKGLDLLQSTQPDLILFSGDMINADPMEAFLYRDLFYNLKAPLGKYSVLGNHDMSDYRRWYTQDKKLPQIEKISKYETLMGFKMLNNSHDYIVRGKDSIALMGVENWGRPPFHAYGDLKKAKGGVPESLFGILLSHDPSHWTEQIIDKTKINLTLSGHTHAMQMGISIAGWEWSPSSIKYPQWGGLYQNKNKDQYLYVNRGFGYLGLAARIGMWPEITVITLKSK